LKKITNQILGPLKSGSEQAYSALAMVAAVAARLMHATGFDAGPSFCSCAAAEADRQTKVNPANTLATKNCAGFLMLNSQTWLRKR
jgi:hypothetical protein